MANTRSNLWQKKIEVELRGVKAKEIKNHSKNGCCITIKKGKSVPFFRFNVFQISVSLYHIIFTPKKVNNKNTKID